jgi:proton-dependent oligopeptide transporter, POT family
LAPKQARGDADLSDDFLGQPKGLAFLFGSEMWERFSYYGMRALLVLYMVDYLLKPERVDQALGLATLKRLFESVSGPLAAQPFASQIYGLYTGLVYLTPILGGWLADHGLGRRRTITLGAALMVVGHFLMAYEAAFLVALLLIALGCGAFKPNISIQVGELYVAADARRDRAYSIFYLGINIGAFLAPLVCGTLGETVDWRYGFAAAGVGMAIGLLTYLAGLSKLPPDQRLRREDAAPARSAADFRRAIFCLSLLFLPSALFWAAFEQQGNTIALFAENLTDRSIGFLSWRTEIPVTWFQAFNPLMIILFTPVLVDWWARRAAVGAEPSTLRKLSLGCLGLAASYLLLAFAAAGNEGGKASWLWLLIYFVVITLSELHFSPITLSFVSRIAPAGSRAVLMGFWFTSMFVGNLLAGWIGGYWSKLSSVEFFLMVSTLGFIAAAIVEAARGPLRKTVSASRG